MFKMFRNKKGFSLVELIVVIAILGVISAIAVPAVLNTLSDSKIKADVATAQAIVKSVNLAIVSINSDSDSSNDIDTASGGYSDLPTALQTELKKLYPTIDTLAPQSNSKGSFEITITKADPAFEGSVSFEDSKNTTHTVDQSGGVK